MAAMARTDIKAFNCDTKVIRSLISIFDSQLLKLAAVSTNELGPLLSSFPTKVFANLR